MGHRNDRSTVQGNVLWVYQAITVARLSRQEPQFMAWDPENVGPTDHGLIRLGLSFGASLSPCPVGPTVFGAFVLWAHV